MHTLWCYAPYGHVVLFDHLVFKLDVCKQMLIVYDKVMVVMDLFDIINKNCFFIFSDIIHEV